MNVIAEKFGLINEKEVELFTLKNTNDIEIKITNYGGIITSIKVPDKNGVFKNIVLGFDDLESYVSPEYLGSYPCFGCLVGRFGNRIAKGKFVLDGEMYSLAINNGENHLHGGLIGYDKVVWEANSFQANDTVGVDLSYLSIDGEEGYPGNLKVKVRYSLNDENEFKVEYFGETDKATPINLTQHSYFNLGDEKTIRDHYLQLNCKEFNEVDAGLIPTGKLLSVENTFLDFRNKRKIGEYFTELEEGYDNNFSLDNEEGSYIKVGDLSDKISGRLMEVFTTEVGAQLYTGVHIPELTVDGEKKFGSFSGVALETQHFPDSVNHEHFPSVILRPGDEYYQKTVFKFSVLG